METLPGIMPGNTLTPLPLPPPSPSVPLFIFDSLFLSSSVCQNNEPAAPLPLLPLPKRRLLALRTRRTLTRASRRHRI